MSSGSDTDDHDEAAAADSTVGALERRQSTFASLPSSASAGLSVWGVQDVVEAVCEFLPPQQALTARTVNLALYNAVSNTSAYMLNGRSWDRFHAASTMPRVEDAVAVVMTGVDDDGDPGRATAVAARFVLISLCRDLATLDLSGADCSFMFRRKCGGSETNAASEAAQGILQLPNLTALRLGSETQLPSAALAAVPPSNALRVLDVCRSAVRWGPSHAAILTRFGGLRELALRYNGSAFADASLRHLEGMRYLRKLDLTGNAALLGDGLQHLTQLRHLKTLVLDFCEKLCPARAVPNISRLKGLRRLSTLGSEKVCLDVWATPERRLPPALEQFACVLRGSDSGCAPEVFVTALGHVAGTLQRLALAYPETVDASARPSLALFAANLGGGDGKERCFLALPRLHELSLDLRLAARTDAEADNVRTGAMTHAVSDGRAAMALVSRFCAVSRRLVGPGGVHRLRVFVPPSFLKRAGEAVIPEMAPEFAEVRIESAPVKLEF